MRIGAYAVAVFRICAYIFYMRIIRVLIYAVYADMPIMRMSFPNRICKRIYQQIQAFVFLNWFWGIRSSLNMNAHSWCVQLTFSKSLIRSGGTFEHMSICGFSAYMRFFCICRYPHICNRTHYADFSIRFHADMRISIRINRNRIYAYEKQPHGQL